MVRVFAAYEPGVISAAAVLRAGGLVVFPTETVYGLGADAFNLHAVTKIFAVKRRPSFDPLIVHVAHPKDIEQLATGLDERVWRLAERFWPGPLTLVLGKKVSVPDIVTAGLDTVAIRVPDHPVALELIRLAGTPVAAPSANPFGYVSPTTAAHALGQLGDSVDVILDGGPCRVGLESTIISLVSKPPRLLRPGGIPLEDLEAVLGPIGITADPTPRPLAPGQLVKHYATRTPLDILREPGEKPSVSPGEKVGLLAFRPPADTDPYAVVETLAPDGNLHTAAANLFAALRRLDALGLDRLVAEPCPERGIGLAIMDRLRRCAAKQERKP